MEHTFDISTFAKKVEEMIAKNDQTWRSGYFSESRRSYTYTPEEVKSIIESGTLAEQQKLSRVFFEKDGLYKRIIIGLTNSQSKFW